jgi:uncharacterized protein (TIGR03067 family)
VLEVIILTVLGRNIAERARGAGRSGTGAVLMLIGLWVVGAAVGWAALGGGSNLLLGYLGALLGGIAGARLAFALVGPDTSRVSSDTGSWRGTVGGRRQRLVMVLALIGTAVVVALVVLRPGRPTDLDALQGEWVLERVETDGKVLQNRPAERLTIRGNEIRYPGEPEAVRFRIDPEKSPPRMDMDGRAPQSGIYRLEGDQWMLCARSQWDERPTRFETRPGGRSTLYVYRRAGR